MALITELKKIMLFSDRPNNSLRAAIKKVWVCALSPFLTEMRFWWENHYLKGHEKVRHGHVKAGCLNISRISQMQKLNQGSDCWCNQAEWIAIILQVVEDTETLKIYLKTEVFVNYFWESAKSSLLSASSETFFFFLRKVKWSL